MTSFTDNKLQETTIKRNHIIDFMRFFGLIMVVLAHTNPNPIIMQIRTFDVPLLVVVSALSYHTTQSSTKSYLSYMFHRSKRLLIPVYIFLVGYFLVLALLSPNNPDLKWGVIAETFLLLEGIGYVWIIRVFLLIALISPLIYQLHIREKSNVIYMFKLCILFSLYEISLYAIKPFLNIDYVKYITAITHYAIPYGLIFGFGLRLPKLTLREVGIVSIFTFVMFLIYAGLVIFQNEKFVSMWYFKYPPSGYYVYYSITAVCIFWMVVPKMSEWLDKIPYSSKIVRFISINSLWIYLWHIPFVKFFHIDSDFFFLIVLISVILLTFIQNKIYDIVFNKQDKSIKS